MINGNLQWAMLLRKEEEFEFLKGQGNWWMKFNLD
jgi:hypothetical protein